MLEITALTFGYSDLPLLEDLSLYVSQGDIVSIVGPSGCGKTTLFKLIAGLYKPQKGSIKAPALSYMTQEDLLLPWKTVLGNLLFMYALESTGKSISQQKAHVLALLHDMGLEGIEDYYPRALSGGMRQRVSLARALLLARPLLLLDEPFGAIDPFRRKDLYALLKGIQKKYHLTIVLISHDVRDVITLSTQIYYLDQGKLSPGISQELLETFSC